jgi:hypothetical protein
MFSGGQPPYGPGPGGPAGFPAPAPKKSNATLLVVIAGLAVIGVLAVAVVVVLFRSGGEEAPPTAGTSPEASAPPAEEGETEAPVEGAQQGPPYTLPEDPCATFPESKLEEYGLEDGSKSLTDSSSSCSWYLEGEGDTYGSMSLAYSTPYSGSDSVEGATEDFQSNVDYSTDESGDFTERTVHENEDVNLGDEAKLVFATENLIGTNDSVATMLIRKENINIELRYSMSPGLGATEEDPAPLEFSDVEGMMNDLGQQSLNVLGG